MKIQKLSTIKEVAYNACPVQRRSPKQPPVGSSPPRPRLKKNLHLLKLSFIVLALYLGLHQVSSEVISMSIAQNIRYFREQRSLTLDAFSAKTGLPIADCIKIEAGQRPLSSSEITVVCRALGITVDELIADRPHQDTPRDSEGSVVMPIGELQSLLGMMKDK